MNAASLYYRIEAGLASAALAVSSSILLVLGGIFVLVGLFILLKRNSSHRP